jgi:hypothetical protein
MIAGVVVLLLPVVAGCAAIKATEQPHKRDMTVLKPGVPRTHVIAELGAPVWSDKQVGTTVEVFSFKQGYTKATKATRALVHGAADVATVGLWEVVGIPAEAIADGTDVQLEVHYRADQTVDHVKVIKGEQAAHPTKWFALKGPKHTRPPAAKADKKTPASEPSADAESLAHAKPVSDEEPVDEKPAAAEARRSQ